MNERIFELAEQAQYYAEYTTPQGLEWFDKFKEKFAELMLTEFKSVLLDMMDEGQGESDTLDQALTEINEHFGVEE
jgi:hypothetical protein